MGSSFHLVVIQGRRKKRIRRRQRRELPNPIQIPMDVLMNEILTRLLAKSLMRFKCVSKLWSSIITSKYFTNRFLSFPSPRLYLSLEDCNDHSKSVTLSLAPSSSSCSSFEVEHDLSITKMEGCILQNHLRGFMWCTSPGKTGIFNPATRQFIPVPIVKLKPNDLASLGYGTTFKFRISFYSVGHDPIRNHYKVVCTIGMCSQSWHQLRSDHWVFVLGGGVWRNVTPPPKPDFLPHMPVTRVSVCIHGVLYYLAWVDLYRCAVVSFDVSSEEFNMIHVPRNNVYGKIKNVSLIEYDGKVTVFDQTNIRLKGLVDLWVLEDVQRKNWSRKTLVLQPCQYYLVDYYISFKVFGTSQNGKVLLMPYGILPCPFYFLCYDLQRNDLRKIEIKGIPDYWCNRFEKSACTVLVDAMLMEQSENLMYLDVSSNS